MDQDVKMRLEVMTSLKEDAVFSNYPTRSGKSTDDHMCDKVLNYVPKHLTFITRCVTIRRRRRRFSITITITTSITITSITMTTTKANQQ